MHANYKELKSLRKRWFRLGLGLNSIRLIFMRRYGGLCIYYDKIFKGEIVSVLCLVHNFACFLLVI